VRLFLDTSILVSAAATRGLCADLCHLVLAEHQLLLGQTVLEEFERVTARQPRLTPIALPARARSASPAAPE
jgi:predicted nucleic acid-binding protein